MQPTTTQIAPHDHAVTTFLPSLDQPPLSPSHPVQRRKCRGCSSMHQQDVFLGGGHSLVCPFRAQPPLPSTVAPPPPIPSDAALVESDVLPATVDERVFTCIDPSWIMRQTPHEPMVLSGVGDMSHGSFDDSWFQSDFMSGDAGSLTSFGAESDSIVTDLHDFQWSSFVSDNVNNFIPAASLPLSLDTVNMGLGLYSSNEIQLPSHTNEENLDILSEPSAITVDNIVSKKRKLTQNMQCDEGETVAFIKQRKQRNDKYSSGSKTIIRKCTELHEATHCYVVFMCKSEASVERGFNKSFFSHNLRSCPELKEALEVHTDAISDLMNAVHFGKKYQSTNQTNGFRQKAEEMRLQKEEIEKAKTELEQNNLRLEKENQSLITRLDTSSGL